MSNNRITKLKEYREWEDFKLKFESPEKRDKILKEREIIDSCDNVTDISPMMRESVAKEDIRRHMVNTEKARMEMEEARINKLLNREKQIEEINESIYKIEDNMDKHFSQKEILDMA
ncbi:MAG: hypothetical protein ACRCXT_20345, partial [Paraclostridium sp.]